MAYDPTIAYATPAEYRERNGRVSTNDDEMVRTLLTEVSRVVDRRCGVADGMFYPHDSIENPSPDLIVFTFDAFGGRTLYLRDAENMQYLLRAVNANLIEIDGGDGAFDEYALDLADAWLRGIPANASTFNRPFTALEFLPHVTGATVTTWPAQVAAVRITGDWGWASTPGAIKERVIGITRELIDAHHAGAAMMVSQIEEAISSMPAARALMYMLEKEFSYRIPSFA